LVIWVMMITAAVNQGWPGDIDVKHYQEFGLPIPSVIRTAKIATLEAEGAEKIGRISSALLAEVRASVEGILGVE
jgi:mRNA interferase MazF